VLVVTNGRVGHRTVSPSELPPRHSGQGRPERLSAFQVDPRAGRRVLEGVIRRLRRSGATRRRRSGSSPGRCSRTGRHHRPSLPLLRRARPATRNSVSESVPMRSLPARFNSSIWRSFASCAGCGRRCGPRSGSVGVKGTSRTHSETDDFETPSVCAMSASVRLRARKARACSCSLTLPR